MTAVDLTEAPDVSITPEDNCADAINGLLSPPSGPSRAPVTEPVSSALGYHTYVFDCDE